MPIRIALSLLLLLAVAGTASARDVRHLAPDGDSAACPEATVTGDAPMTTGAESRTATPAGRSRATPAARSADGGGGRTPRWHSFLPGMFR